MLYNKALKDYKKLQSDFGQKLKLLRERQNLSLRDLAARCELDFSKIGKIEAGQTNLKLSSIFELAKGLGVEAKELLNF
ncbi:helix-turn-helix domain-containing protein [Mucilaginibacter ginkgonis]|uniref:Helix-turn-helix transcriptional regulator n=1 Tax=Mucilaginibacter ginkgonis TaxID=2682091 RepID=A0A6I4IMP9_9SPHI|nr:helix-turn-helix transcriptional regulator [Mucilaginibacter ginkgonis]QQL50279.1 helix-turn-helix transcriptional regulator [Mucilaginibacter ginkgonis]